MKSIFKKCLIFAFLLPVMCIFAGCKGKNNNSNNQDQSSPSNPPVTQSNYNVELDLNLPEKYSVTGEKQTSTLAVGTNYVLPTFSGTIFDGYLDHFVDENGEEIEESFVSGIKNETVKIKAVWNTDLSVYLQSAGLEFDYDSESNTACLTGSNSTTDTVLILPSKVVYNSTEYTVNVIAENAFLDNQNYTKVLTYATNLQVNTSAFKNSNLAYFDCEILQSVGASAFAGTKLESVTFSDRLTSLSTNVFEGCELLASANFSAVSSTNILSVPDETFLNCSNLVSFVPSSNIKNVGNRAFKNASKFNDVSFLNVYSFIKIGYSAFENTAVVTVDINNSMTVNVGAFAGCSIKSLSIDNLPYDTSNLSLFLEIYGSNIKQSLKVLTLGENITEIYANYFENFIGLETVDLTACESLVSIGSYAFYNCSNLITVSFYQNANTSAFNASAFSNTAWINSMTEPFVLNKTLLFVPANYSPTDGVANLAEIDEIEHISEYVFKNNSNIVEVNLPASVVSIGNSAFYNCSNLTKITFENGSNLKNIGNSAFNKCSKLVDINLANCTSLSTIGNYAFQSIGEVETFFIPANVTSIGTGVFKLSKVKSFSIGDNANYSVIGGGLYLINGATPVKLLCYPAGATSAFVEIPATVTTIESYAFLKNTYIRYIRVKGTGVNIQNFAFSSLDSDTVVVLIEDNIALNNNFVENYRFLADTYYTFDSSNFTISSLPYEDKTHYFAVVSEDIYLIEVSVSGETITVVSSEKIEN